MSIRVLLADDHTIVRDGLRALLEANPGIKVVGGAANGKQAVSMVKELAPDIVIMDISMPGLNGIDATQHITEGFPKVRVIILSMLGTADYIFHAMQAGVRGFLLKESAGREVMDAVKTVSEGEMYFSRPIIDTVINDYMQGQGDGRAEALSKLNPQENDILHMLVQGKNIEQIAKYLKLSPKRVETQRSKIMEKLNLEDFSDMIKFAVKHSLISSE